MMNISIKKTVTIAVITIIVSFFVVSLFAYNSYEAKVSNDYKVVEYNNNTYFVTDLSSQDIEFDKKIKTYQCGESLYSQWLVSPMCYVSIDKEYIKIITEDDTIESKVLYYSLDGNK